MDVAAETREAAVRSSQLAIASTLRDIVEQVTAGATRHRTIDLLMDVIQDLERIREKSIG